MKKWFVVVTVLVIQFGCFAQSQVNLTQGLIGCYSFSGDATDQSTTQNHGTVYSAVLTDDRFGNSNSAYFFNGMNSYISISSSALMNPNYSYSIWAKVLTNPGPGSSGILFSIGDAFNSKHQTVNVANVYASDELVGWNVGGYNNGTPGTTSLQSKIMPVVGEWYHLVGTRNANEMKMYINGVLVTTGSTFGLSPYYGDGTNTTAHIGLRCNYSQPFNGIIDDFVIYNREITAEEVLKLYQDGLPCSEFSVQSVSRCGSGQVVLEAQGSSGYSWYSSTGDLLYEGNPFVVSVTQSTVFRVKDHLNQFRDVHVNISDEPLVECVFPQFLELNEPSELRVLISGGTGPFNVRWEESGQLIPNATSTSVQFRPQVARDYNFEVFVTDKNNCVNSCERVVPTAFYVENVSRCGAGLVEIEAHGSTDYSWYNEAGNLLFQGNPFVVSVTGNSVFKVKDHFNLTKAVQVNVHEIPKVECEFPMFLVTNSANKFEVQVTGGTAPYYIQWQEDGQPITDQSNLAIERIPRAAGEYEVQVFVTDQNNCVSSCGEILETGEVFIPNVITPNSDQKNDLFNLYLRWGDQYYSYEGSEFFMIRLYNRWGKAVFETSDPSNGWNALSAASGIYFYEVTLGSNVWKGPLHVIN